MTKKIFLAVILLIASTSACFAYGFSAVSPSGHTLYYNIVSGNAVVTRQNYGDPSYTNLIGNLVIPSSVTNGSTTYNVTSIGEDAFEDCSGLTSVTIPNSVTSIGDDAFRDCRGLTSVTIPNSVTSIGDEAFFFCSGLTSVTIGNSVTSIGNSAFSWCGGLTSVNYTGTIAQWCGINFSSSSSNPTYYSHSLSINGSPLTNLVIPAGVTEIKRYAFYNCSGLTSVTIPNSVTSIGYEAFYDCSGLTSVTIGNSVTSIVDEAFHGCSGLTSVTIPNSVIYIGTFAFYHVRHIEYYGSATGSPWGAISMNGVTEGDFVYSDATKHHLAAYIGTGGAVTIPSTVDTIGNMAFYVCSGLTSVTIPNSVTRIGSSAFYFCSGLTSVTIGGSVTSIGSSAFYYCSGLTSVTIPNSVTSIGFSAFEACSGLTSVTIGNSVTSIGDYAFQNCSGLTSITSLATVPPQCYSNYDFSGVDKSIPVYVPCESVTAYQSAEVWSDFTNIRCMNVGIEDVNDAGVIIYSRDGRIVVCGAEGMEMRVFDMMGREVVSPTRSGETPILPQGVYLVKVGTLPARKVVVL